MAEQYKTQGNLLKAKEFYDEVLRSVGSSKNGAVFSQPASHQLGIIYYSSKNYDKAINYFTTAQNMAEYFSTKQVPEDKAILLKLLGQSHFGSENYTEAERLFDEVIRILRNMPKADMYKIHDTQIWKARTMIASGNGKKSMPIFEQVLEEDPLFVPALTYYSKIAVEHDQHVASISFLLKALISDDKDKADKSTQKLIPRLMADTVQKIGVPRLLEELDTAKDEPSALAFLAQTIKEQGAVPEAIMLYELSAQKPNLQGSEKANIILNLVNSLEIAYRYQECINWIQDYMKQNVSLCVGDMQIGKFYKIIQDVSPIGTTNMLSGTAKCHKWMELPQIFDAGKVQVKVPGSEIKIANKQKEIAMKGKYSEIELNVLSMMLTCVKLLYVTGGLQVIPALINLVEPLRVGRELHLTNARNEHAYYCCVAQVMSKIPFPVYEKKIEKDTIYVCGDSHCLSSAWQRLNIKGRDRPCVLVPKLVTGMKMWHLREECRFFTKINFENAMKSIPDGSSVIFVFGEIDCREGLLMAVEKLKYKSLDEGINFVINDYLKALTKVASEKKLRAYIQPVVPVLDLTRKMVKQFNAILRDYVRKHKTLQYLDFFEDLLDSNGSFNLKYELDGTHMGPAYCPLLERTLAGPHKIDRT